MIATKGRTVLAARFPHIDAETHCVQKKIGFRAIPNHQRHFHEALRLKSAIAMQLRQRQPLKCKLQSNLYFRLLYFFYLLASLHFSSGFTSLLHSLSYSSLFSTSDFSTFFTSLFASLPYSYITSLLDFHFPTLSTSLLFSLPCSSLICVRLPHSSLLYFYSLFDFLHFPAICTSLPPATFFKICNMEFR